MINRRRPKIDDADAWTIKKTHVAPSDIIILSTDLMLTREQANDIRERLIEAIGDVGRVVVLSAGLKISVLTRAEIEDLLQ